MINLDEFKFDDFSASSGTVLATLLELSIYQLATQKVIINNQALIAKTINSDVDVDSYINESDDQILDIYNELKASIFSKL